MTSSPAPLKVRIAQTAAYFLAMLQYEQVGVVKRMTRGCAVLGSGICCSV